jgi:hypothetical protein
VAGCCYSLTHDDTLSTMMYMPAFVVGVFTLIVPGLWLRSQNRFRWFGQLLLPLLLGGRISLSFIFSRP